MKLLNCPVCRALTLEVSEAYRGLWDSASSQFRDSFLAVRNMRTEEDVFRAEELLKGQQESSPQIAAAYRKLRAHQAATGHRLLP